MPETVAVPAADDTRSLTYKELGDARGISAASAKRLALRHGWHKEPGNDGLARVRVPVSALETLPAANGARYPGDVSPATVSVATLARVQQEAESAIRAAEARAEQAAQEAAELRVRLAHREGELEGQRESMRRADAATEREAEGRRMAEVDRDAARAEAAALRGAEADARGEAARERQAREAAEGELAAWADGGRLRRAWRAFRGRGNGR